MDYSAGFIVIFALLGIFVTCLILFLTGFHRSKLDVFPGGSVGTAICGFGGFICAMIGFKFFGYL